MKSAKDWGRLGMRSSNSEIIIYQTEDGITKIDVRMEDETVWLSQAQMADLFQTTKQNISLHINNAFEESELEPDSVVKEYLTTAADGKNYRTKYYSLDVIISVGYRVKSLRGTQFRRWALEILKEYLKKGFAMNDDLLKKADGGNYWCELLELDDFAKRYGNGIFPDTGSVSHQATLEKAEAEYEKYRKKTIDELSPAEQDFFTTIKKTQRMVDGKKRKKDGGDGE
jgi:hypothetical protein